jgi:iron complex outermembrane receptor protein
VARPDLVLPVDSETVKAYEVGFKMARRAFSFDVSGFYYDFRNLQVTGAVPDPVCVAQGRPICPNTSVFTNAPKAEIYGVDGQFSFKPIDILEFRAGAAYLHARYKNFTNFVGTSLNPVTNTNVSETQDLSGQQMSRSPTFSGNAGVDLNLPMGDGGLLISGNVRYTDSYVISNPSIFGPRVAPELRNKQRFRQGSYALLSAQATWTDPSGHISLGVFGNNLTNKTYRMTYNGGTFGDYSAQAEPRTYGVRAGYKF